jgi:hypothetical protein
MEGRSDHSRGGASGTVVYRRDNGSAVTISFVYFVTKPVVFIAHARQQQ